MRRKRVKMFFQEVTEAAPDPIFGLLGSFKADPRKEKISLMVGIYKDDHLKADLLSSVQKAKHDILAGDLMADYLPIDGLKELSLQLGPIVFGKKIWDASSIYAAHTTGGTAALRVGAEFIIKEVGQNFCIPEHTWPNHRLILERAGGKIETYPYYSREKHGFDFERMIAFLKNLPAKTAVILHACCHNPTGSDPTEEEWKEISSVMKERALFPFFDCAYQGLGEGLEKDSFAIRQFVRDGHEMAVAYSCSKNFSMYCQRVGVLFLSCENDAVKLKVGSQVKKVIRALYSNPPAHGARIVAEVLKRDDLRGMWEKDLGSIRRRISLMRETLIQRLNSQAKPLKFDYLKMHKGMFSFIDLEKAQVQQLIEKFAIYMTDNGRISIPGLTMKNIDYVVNGLVSVIK